MTKRIISQIAHSLISFCPKMLKLSLKCESRRAHTNCSIAIGFFVNFIFRTNYLKLEKGVTIVKENCFWSNVDTSFNEHVDVGV
jgi:hypothetical protein